MPRGLLTIGVDGSYALQIYHTVRTPFAGADYQNAGAAEYKKAVLTASTHFGHLSVGNASRTLSFRIADALEARLARAVEHEVLSLARSASGAAGLEGNVRVSGPPLLLSELVIPGMREALLRMPAIALEFVGEIREANLVRRDADIALRLQRPSAPSVTAKLLATIGFGLYATPQYLAGTPEDGWAFIAYNDSLAHTPQQQWIDSLREGRRIAAAGVRPARGRRRPAQAMARDA